MEEKQIKEADFSAHNDQFLTFTIDTQEYGIDIRHVTEIVGIQKIPHHPALI